MSSHHEEHLGLCAGLVLGALSEADRLEIESHLAEGCPVCDAELSRLAEGATLLAASAPPASPSPALKARVFATLRAEGIPRSATAPAAADAPPAPRKVIPLPPRQQRPMGIVAWAFAAAAAVLAVTSVAMWQAATKLSGELAATRQQVEAQRDQLAVKQQQLEDAQKWSALIEGAGTRVVDLQLTPAGNAVLRARAVYDPQTRRAMIVFSNFTAPAGSDYELWALRDGKPSSLGLIHADASGRAVMKLPDMGDPTGLGAFAVSLERAGGSSTKAAPQGPVVMVGKLAGS